MPGPSSSKTSLTPRGPWPFTTSSSSSPPPPCTSVLRASSLAAVTTFVCSTRVKPTATAASRTVWRTRTTSSWVRIGMRSLRASPGLLPLLERRLDELHALLDVEGGAHPGEREPELHEGDRHRRLHAHHHRLRVEHPRHRRDV